MKRSTVQRLATSLVGAPLALGVVFFAPGDFAFALFFVVVFWAATEFIPLAYKFAPTAPFWTLRVLIPAATLGGFAATRVVVAGGEVDLTWLAAGVTATLLAVVTTTLLSSTEARDGLNALGILTFAVPYFALPPILLYRLQVLDPWLVFVLFAIVWLGDTAAYYFGSWLGRHKLAPSVSPNKSWEGAIASFATGLLAAALWSHWRLGEVPFEWLVVAGVTSIAAQLGDLVESLIKRGAGVKDSAGVLPGHGGFFDRLDATILATPVFVTGAWILGFESLIPG